MLKNISSEILILRFAGMQKSLAPGECIDIEKEFGAGEDRFVHKFAGKLEKFIQEEKAPNNAGIKKTKTRKR